MNIQILTLNALRFKFPGYMYVHENWCTQLHNPREIIVYMYFMVPPNIEQLKDIYSVSIE